MRLSKSTKYALWILLWVAIFAALLVCAHIGNNRFERSVQGTVNACVEDEVIAFDGTCTHPDVAEYYHGKWYPIVPPVSITKNP